MLIYWVMLAISSAAALSTTKYHRHVTDLTWFIVALLFIVIIGFRWEVGRDWSTYYMYFGDSYGVTLHEWLVRTHFEDSAYFLLNWIAANSGLSFSAVNLICAAIFVAGLFSFCRKQPEPWLALAVATPILVIIVAMGYTRQSAAVGIIFFALEALLQKSLLRFVFFIALATVFHKSAILLAPIGILVNTSKRLWLFFLLLIMLFVFLKVQPWERSVGLISSYEIAAKYGQRLESPGSYVRIAMNVFPAVIFLWFRKRFQLKSIELSLWSWMSIFAISSILQLALISSSTIVDRIAIYFIPVQIFVYSRFQCLFKPRSSQQFATAIVIIVYVATQFIWFNSGNNSFAWVPYKFYPLEAFF
jgi:hypothetical protein